MTPCRGPAAPGPGPPSRPLECQGLSELETLRVTGGPRAGLQGTVTSTAACGCKATVLRLQPEAYATGMSPVTRDRRRRPGEPRSWHTAVRCGPAARAHPTPPAPTVTHAPRARDGGVTHNEQQSLTRVSLSPTAQTRLGLSLADSTVTGNRGMRTLRPRPARGTHTVAARNARARRRTGAAGRTGHPVP